MRKISSMLHSCSVNILSGSGVWLVLLMLLTFGIYGIESNYFNYPPLSHHLIVPGEMNPPAQFLTF